MISIDNDKIYFTYDQCQQCGACLAVCPVDALSFKKRRNGLADISVDHDKCIFCKRCFRACPANKPQETGNYFDGMESREYFLAYNIDNDIRRLSSSGGVCKTLIIESLRTSAVDGVYSLRKLEEYPSAVGEFYTADNIPDYDTLPNSVYHSVMQCLELAKVKKCRRLMIIGTACQLKALTEALKGRFDVLVKVCIFCKQQKTLDSTRFLAKVAGTKLPANEHFTATYRGGGWPGTVTVNGKSIPWHRAAQLPFGHRLWTVPGCNICGDPFGFSADADISLMDPWIIRPHNALGETLVTVNTPIGLELLKENAKLHLTQLSYEEAKPALGITDIKRKQALIPFFKGDKLSARIFIAGKAEQFDRAFLIKIVTILPKMPMIFYRLLCKLPDWRNIILRKP